MSDRIDIGNVRGIQGERGAKGDKGSTPSYDDLKYKKVNDDFVTILGTGTISIAYYLDTNDNKCNEEGYLLDENDDITDVLGEPFDVEEYGYYYRPVFVDEEERFTNQNGELIDENGDLIYVASDFISDVTSYIYSDESAYNQLVDDVQLSIADTLVSANPNDAKYRDFFNAIEGDMKYYICADNPSLSIYINSSDELVNTCKYKDENGNYVLDNNSNYAFVPLEKNALYLYNTSGVDENSIMHYDVYLCTKAGTVPKKLISSADFIINYNTIDDVIISVTNGVDDEDDEIYLNIYVKDADQFCTESDVEEIIQEYMNSQS